MKTLSKIFKDPGSAITHFFGMAAAIVVAAPLLLRTHDPLHTVSMAIFICSMVLLYGASTTYHTFDISESVNTLLKKIDHSMIFVLIAGTYTPVCLIVLNGRTGFILLSVVWGIALAGIVIKSFWIFCPKWFSSILYIAMGWICVFAMSPILNTLSSEAFIWLFGGGVLYTAGGIIYALKLPIFNENHKFFNSHVIFHIFVLAGSACHYILMYRYVVNMPV